MNLDLFQPPIARNADPEPSGADMAVPVNSKCYSKET